MSKILYIHASPLEELSHSRGVADAFVEAYRQAHPDEEVDVFDLFKEDLPPFDGPAARAKYAILHGQEHTEKDRENWTAIEEVEYRGEHVTVMTKSCPPVSNSTIPSSEQTSI